jgi:hypothetical protein
MKTFQQLLLGTCLVSTLGWASLGLAMIWSGPSQDAENMWRVTASFGVVTIASVISLGALFYTRERI